MPNNCPLAKERLKTLLEKFSKYSTFHEEYKSFVHGIMEKGYAEIVSTEQVNNEMMWYLPHHGVYHLRKHTLRVVFDYSVSFQ